MDIQNPPRIADAEFAERRERLRQRMQAAGVDLFIAYSDDRATYGQQHARYLFDYQPHFEPCLSIVPLEGDAFIATGPESEALVLASSRCRNVRIVDAFVHPDEEYPFIEIGSLAGLLKAGGATAKRRIAVAGGDAMPRRLWEALAGVADGPFADGEAMILALRAVKSAAEIAVIRHAYRIAEAGMRAGLAAVAEGVSEREIAAEAEYAMRRMGSEGMGIDTIVGSGRENTFAIITRTTPRRIARGEHVLLTLAPRYEGYHGAIGRVAAVGDVDARIAHAMDTAIAAQAATAAALRPGTIGKELDAIAREVCRKAGYEKNFAYTGIHSVGTVEFEPPILTSHSETRLVPDMVFSIDIPIFFAPWGGLRLEDGFLVTHAGAEPLQEIPQAIHRVG